MFVSVKLENKGYMRITFIDTLFIGRLNKVGNIDILVLRRVCERLHCPKSLECRRFSVSVSGNRSVKFLGCDHH